MATPDPKNTPPNEPKPRIESKPVVENKSGTTTQGSSMKKWVLIGAIVFVLAGGAAFFAIPYLKGVRQASAVGKNSSAEGKSVASGSAHEKVKASLALDPFLVNLADTDEIRFVKTTFQLGLAEELDEETKSPIIVAAMRDSIISLLSSKTAEQILTPQGKDKLREEIRLRVGSVSPKIKVLEVYIVDFVVQL